jgi:hypothetical protein
VAMALGAAALAGCDTRTGGAPEVRSHDASLSALVVTADDAEATLSPGFASDVHLYSTAVRPSTQALTVTATATAPRVKSIQVAQLGAAPATAASGVATPIAMPAAGAGSSVRVMVTAEDGVTTTGYTINLSRAALGTNATLASLTDSAAALNFTGATSYTYTLTSAQAAGYTITPTLTDPFASMTVNGNHVVSGAPVAVDLSSSSATETIVVTSEDGNVQTTYTLHITVPSAGTNATLATLTDSAGALNYTGATAYTYQVPNTAAAGYTITPTLTDPNASMTINGSAATSGAAAAVNLSSQAATVTIVVTSASGTVHTTYTLDITVFQVVVPVTGVAVSGTGNQTVIAGVGGTLQLTATVTPSNAIQVVTWSTSDSSVATVSSSGLVTGQKLGEATIKAAATDASGVTGTINLVVSGNGVVFVQQPGSIPVPPATTPNARASLSGGTIAVSATYSSSGNAFKYANGGYYGTNSNGFVCLPFKLKGDFSMTASVSLLSTPAPKYNNACGIGLGVSTGFLNTDVYAYTLMPNPAAAGSNQDAAPRYVTGLNAVTASSTILTTTQYTIPTATPVVLTFARSGSNVTFGVTNGNSSSTPTSSLTDGTNVYGAGPLYPCISFNDVSANVTNFVIRDGAGNTIFDSSSGTLANYTPASLVLSTPVPAAPTAQSTNVTVVRGQTVNITATGVQPGGDPADLTASSGDTTVVGVNVTKNASNSTITLTGVNVGQTTVQVNNPSDPSSSTNKKVLTVTVEDFSTSDNYPGTVASQLYPAPGATAAYVDGEMSLTFDSAPTLAATGSIDIYSSAGAIVDRVFFFGEQQTVMNYAASPASPVTINVGPQLARMSGSTVYFTPHFGKLAYGASYYVGVSTTAITGTIGGTTFTGFSSSPSSPTWRFTTRPAPALTTTINVDGSHSTTTADFRSVGGALMYLAAHPIPGATAINVQVAAGTYNELVNYRAAPDRTLTITVSGPAGNARGDTAVVTWVNGGGGTVYANPQNTRATFYFAGANLVMQNLWLKSTGLRASVAQAETLYFDSRFDTSGNPFTLAVNNCSFSSLQDTIQTSGRAWFYNSFIEGNVDFIWGTSDAALFESCDLHVVNDSSTSPYSIFVARTGTTGASTIGKGYVLFKSTVNVDSGAVANYGRDAGQGSFYDQVALVNNTFSGAGTLTAGLWYGPPIAGATTPLALGSSNYGYVGWKSSGNTGLTADTGTPNSATLTITNLSTEYDTRSNILNRVIAVSAGAPTGYAAAPFIWDVSALATAWGAP